MAIIAFPQKPIRGYGNDKGVLTYSFTTAASDPTVVSGDSDMILSNVYSATGIFTITFKKRFTRATVNVSVSGVPVTDTVHITSQTFGRNAACVLVLSCARSFVANAFAGPIIHLTMVITP